MLCPAPLGVLGPMLVNAPVARLIVPHENVSLLSA